jgi:hypothetical protein
MQVGFTFDQDDYGFVRDHCPEDHPVIPFVSAVDTFYTVLQKHVGPCVVQDIRLVKGIILPDFKTFEMRVEIDEDKQTIQLIGENNIVHYKASYVLEVISEKTGIHLPVANSWILASARMTASEPSIKELRGDYDFLFHGPMLHSIVSIQAEAPDKEASGVLKTAIGMGWKKTDWFFDPFACDGALQMGCQLAFMAKQKASLPSKIKQAIFYQKPKNTEISVHLVFQKMSGLHYVFDAHLFDSAHAPVCSLEGVESYFRLFKMVQ